MTKTAVIYRQVLGTVQKMGEITLNDEQTEFAYHSDHLKSGQPGFCLMGDVTDGKITYPVSERIPFPPGYSLSYRKRIIEICSGVNT